MLRHWRLQGLLLGSKRVNGQFQRSLSLARLCAQGRAVQTLDSSKLHPSDHINLAARVQPTFFARDSPFKLRYMQLSRNGKHIPFPENSSGFLYLSSTASKPQSAWQIRFRVTDSNGPQSFKSGADLLHPDQKPWHIPLRSLGSKKYAALWELLLQDGLVDDALLHLRPPRLKQHIQTLDPARLQSADHLNLSGSPQLHIHTQASGFKVTYTEAATRHQVPFPDNARGFLYLHSPAAQPKAMWEIRFRVTDNNCPSSFKSGSDLVYPNETTWAISLGSLHPHARKYVPLRDLLVREGLDVDALLGKIGLAKRKTAASSTLIGISLNQRFRMDFQSPAISLTFVSFGGEQLQCAIEIKNFVRKQCRVHPYSGAAWCRFEAHASPGRTQPDQLAIRIVDMITPVTVSNPELAHRIPMPQAGTLVMRYTKCGPNNGKPGAQPLTLDPRPWTLNAQTTAHPVIQAILRGAAT